MYWKKLELKLEQIGPDSIRLDQKRIEQFRLDFIRLQYMEKTRLECEVKLIWIRLDQIT